MTIPVSPDTTNYSVTLRALDADGFPDETIAYDTAGLSLWYRKGTTGAKTEITPVELTTPALTDAHEAGGLLHVDDGYFRLDLPDAALPSSEGEVTKIGGTYTDGTIIGEKLVGRIGATAALATYDPPTRAELTSDIAGLNDLSAAQVNAEVDSALADYDAPTKAELDTGLAGLNDPTVAEIWAGITAAAGNFIADHVLRRSWASAAASANGDTKGFRSLLGMCAKLVNRVVLSGGTLSVFEADDTTVLGTQTVTTDASAEPVTGTNTDG